MRCTVEPIGFLRDILGPLKSIQFTPDNPDLLTIIALIGLPRGLPVIFTLDGLYIAPEDFSTTYVEAESVIKVMPIVGGG